MEVEVIYTLTAVSPARTTLCTSNLMSTTSMVLGKPHPRPRQWGKKQCFSTSQQQSVVTFLMPYITVTLFLRIPGMSGHSTTKPSIISTTLKGLSYRIWLARCLLSLTYTMRPYSTLRRETTLMLLIKLEDSSGKFLTLTQCRERRSPILLRAQIP